MGMIETVLVAGALAVSAAGGDGAGQAAEGPSALKLAIADVAADRELVIQSILEMGFLPASGNLTDPVEAAGALRRLSDDRLARASLAIDAETFEAAVLGSPVTFGTGRVNQKFLGNATTDLVFTSLSQPCRLTDTRFDDRGPMAPNETRNFAVQGSLISNQGGNAADCPEVPFDPPAVVVTLTSVTSSGMGNLRIWPFGNPVPFVAHVSYPGGINLSNSTVTTICQNCGSQNDFNVRTQNGLSQVIVDIIGYFERPQGCPAGTTEVAGDCYQTSLRAAATFFTATNDCEDEGGRLPSVGGILLALNSLTGVAGGEHTDGVYNADEANTANGFRDLRITSSGTLVSEFTLDTDPYRCVFDLFEFN